MSSPTTTPDHDRDPWEETAGRAPPDGARVMVRRKRDSESQPMIFRSKPIERWESPDGSRVFDFRYFDEWRRLT